MGKGFNNYMCKKFFHPASRDNLKRVWMAEQQTAAYKQKQEELRVQYEKEQDLYTNKAIMSKESKEKLSVNFLYEPPPGTKKDREREDDEPEFKFEWQRRFNAPRESYCKGDQEIRDQPFGIQVRNVRCIKCHKWGHINTDKECPMYNQSAGGGDGGSNLNPSELIRQMREDGLQMKKGAVGLLELPNAPSRASNHQLIPSSSEDEDHMNEAELKFLDGLSTKKKLKLLKLYFICRKLEKMDKKKKKKKQKKDKRKEGNKKRNGSESDSESDSGAPPIKKEKYESNHFTANKEAENELYAVLGRKMDFEGPPQSHSRLPPRLAAGSSSSKGKSRRSRSRSNSRERSRSRTPAEERKRFDARIKEDPDRPSEDARKNKRRPRPMEDEARKKYDRTRRERSASREKYRRRSRSRSREQHRRSRSPHQRESGRNGSSHNKHRY
ncbi:hypothetical protein ONE63_008838 [Megalurothrips usitatus]|uniref:CBF1-interacting co-repressor CIR N-terminal domain-containing protein n=1 Tax=Megalurothrips usitatus TaxID=439358 RepID=A0AAV7XNJ7_9NEOP|nr:hypothetical protein ONE63_008838 [Megalurothrips usitatus]